MAKVVPALRCGGARASGASGLVSRLELLMQINVYLKDFKWKKDFSWCKISGFSLKDALVNYYFCGRKQQR